MNGLSGGDEMLVFGVREMCNMRFISLKLSVLCILLGLVVIVSAQGRRRNEVVGPNDAFAGKQLFRSPEWTATGLTCIHCHADFNEKKDPDGKVRPGHSLFNAGYRNIFNKWDKGTTHSLQEAIRACMVRWVTKREEKGNSGVEPAQHHLRQVIAFLKSENMIQESKTKSIEPMWTEQIPGDRMLKVGDVALGFRLFRRSCEACHASDGTGPAPSLVKNGYSRYQIAKKIRHINNPGLNGLVMPAFPLDRLSDRELINVVVYVFQM
jgi:mono/diheme cytochrome c family protein